MSSVLNVEAGRDVVAACDAEDFVDFEGFEDFARRTAIGRRTSLPSVGKTVTDERERATRPTRNRWAKNFGKADSSSDEGCCEIGTMSTDAVERRDFRMARAGD